MCFHLQLNPQTTFIGNFRAFSFTIHLKNKLQSLEDQFLVLEDDKTSIQVCFLDHLTKQTKPEKTRVLSEEYEGALELDSWLEETLLEKDLEKYEVVPPNVQKK